ncbi:hypothetical protein Tco_1434966, partial [Tanacetum coccineum]
MYYLKDRGTRPEEQHLVVLCFDVKFPPQPATTKISGEDGSNLEDFLIVLTREEVDIIRLIMALEEKPLMMLGSGPNIIKEGFSNDLDGQHSIDENKVNSSSKRNPSNNTPYNIIVPQTAHFLDYIILAI